MRARLVQFLGIFLAWSPVRVRFGCKNCGEVSWDLPLPQTKMVTPCCNVLKLFIP